MKKLIYFIMLSVLFVAFGENASAKPIYINIRVGFFAKWEITSEECKDGWGICLQTPIIPDESNASLGFDDTKPNVICLKIKRKIAESKYLENGKFEISEDSPIDPKLIMQLTTFKNPLKRVVVIKKGTYTVTTTEEYYTLTLNYYLQ